MVRRLFLLFTFIHSTVFSFRISFALFPFLLALKINELQIQNSRHNVKIGMLKYALCCRRAHQNIHMHTNAAKHIQIHQEKESSKQLKHTEIHDMRPKPHTYPNPCSVFLHAARTHASNIAFGRCCALFFSRFADFNAFFYRCRRRRHRCRHHHRCHSRCCH